MTGDQSQRGGVSVGGASQRGRDEWEWVGTGWEEPGSRIQSEAPGVEHSRRGEAHQPLSYRSMYSAPHWLDTVTQLKNILPTTPTHNISQGFKCFISHLDGKVGKVDRC